MVGLSDARDALMPNDTPSIRKLAIDIREYASMEFVDFYSKGDCECSPFAGRFDSCTI